ncbi:MAG: hypothetical protein OXK79_05555, partial [Chloroflexota bacterium]|nr:hypothetical protein [Chloroflexota bacterium]
HRNDRGLQPYPPRRATSPDTATPGPLNNVKGLREAHRELDRLVDSLYRPTPFADDADRLNLLLDKYSGLSIDHPGEEVAESC